MTVEPFKREHARQIELQDAQADGVHVSDAYLESIERDGPAATMRDAHGRIICCAGLVERVDHSHLWCCISRHAGPHMLAIYRGAKRLVSVAQHTVVATSVRGYEPGCRLLTMLGFEKRAPLPGYGISGEDHDLYVRA